MEQVFPRQLGHIRLGSRDVVVVLDMTSWYADTLPGCGVVPGVRAYDCYDR